MTVPRDCVHARSRDYPSIAAWTARQCATRPGYEKMFQWRADLIKIDVGSKPIDARIDAVWPRPKQETAAGNEVRQDFLGP
jgi:hypothetical protein